MGLFYDEDLRKVYGHPFGFHSDFSDKVSRGRNITLFQSDKNHTTFPCVLSDISSLFRLTDDCLSLYDEYNEHYADLPPSMQKQAVYQHLFSSVEKLRRGAVRDYYKECATPTQRLNESVTTKVFCLYNFCKTGEMEIAKQILFFPSQDAEKSTHDILKKLIQVKEDWDIKQRRAKDALHNYCFRYLFKTVSSGIFEIWSIEQLPTSKDFLRVIDILIHIVNDIHICSRERVIRALDALHGSIEISAYNEDIFSIAAHDLKECLRDIFSNLNKDFYEGNPKVFLADINYVVDILAYREHFLSYDGLFLLQLTEYLESGCEDKTINFIIDSFINEYAIDREYYNYKVLKKKSKRSRWS